MKKESHQSRNQWWIWSREAGERAPAALSSTASESPGKPDTKVKILWVRKLTSTIDRRDPLFAKKERTDSMYAHTHQVTQNGMLIKLGLLKSGKLMNWWTTERRDPLFAQKERLKHVSLVTARTSFWKKQIAIERRDPLVCSQRAQQFVVEDDEDRIRIVAGIQIILAQGEWSSAKEAKTILKDATKDSDKHSMIWWMFMSSTLEASVFMGKNYSHNLAFHQK